MGFFDSFEGSERHGDEKKQSHKANRKIVCDVKNCAYHDGNCYCSADKITVGPSYATSCSDTVCATFKQRYF